MAYCCERCMTMDIRVPCPAACSTLQKSLELSDHPLHCGGCDAHPGTITVGANRSTRETFALSGVGPDARRGGEPPPIRRVRCVG